MKRILLFVCVLISLSLTTQAQNWSFTSTAGPYGATVNDLSVASNGALLAATQGGLFRSTDNGATWTRIIVSAQNNAIGIQDIEVSSTGTIYAVLSTSNANQYGPFTSTDNGLTWSKLTPTGLVFIVPKKIKAAPSGKLYLVFQNSAALYRSTDGGTTWQNSSTVGSNINDIDIDSNNKVYLSTQSSSVQLSTNDGVNFNVASGSGGLSTSAVVYSATLDGSNNLYALSSDGPWRLLSAGGSWSSVKTASLTDASYSGFLESDGSNLYLLNTSGKSWSATSPSASIVWSGGNSYSVNNPNSVNAVLFQSSSAWYIGRFNSGVDKSTDSGANWTTTSAGMAGIVGNTARLFRTSNGRILYASGALSFQLSIDDGTTWAWSTSTNTNRSITDFVQLSDGSILAYGFGGVIRSTDQGSTWAQQTASGISNIATADGSNLYNYNGLVINKSTDKGVTWNSMGITGLSTGPINKLLADNSGNLYLMYYSGTAWELWKIPNATTVAAKVTAFNAPALNDFTIVGNNLYALGNNSLLYKSTDGGTSFTTSSILAASVKIWAYDDSNLFIQAGTGTFQHSSDGGASWITKTLNDNTLASVTDIVFSSSQYLFVSTNFSVMQKSSTPVIIPTPPSGLVVSAAGIQTVDLTWNDNASNETGYEVEYSIGNNTSYQLGFAYRGQIFSPQNKVLLSGGVPADSVTTYYYRVRAVNSAGNSAYSNEVSSLGLLSCTSTVPDNRSWTAVTTADPGSTASGAGPFTNNAVGIQKTNKNSFTVSLFELGVVPAAVGLSPPPGPAFFTETCGQTYFQNDDLGQNYAHGLGTWNSGTKTLTLKWQTDPTYYGKFEGTTTLTLNATDPIPASPTATAYIITGTQNLVVWTSVPFATQYDIFRSTTSGSFGTTPLATVNYPTIQYVDSPVTPGTTYYYTVKAKNAAGSSAASAQTSVTPPVSTLFTPVANSLALITENQQGVAWGDLDGDGDEDYVSASFQASTGAFTLPVLFENVGSNQFTRRTLAVLTGENVGVYRGASVVDVNNDGKLDVYFPRQGNNSLADLVLLNNGSWNFTKVIVAPSSSYANFRAASLADYDRDGLVDVLITDVDASGVAVPPILLKNTSSGGNLSVTNITSAGTLTSNTVIGREVSWADFNNDGLQDAFVPFYNANASTPSPNVPNRLYKNNGDGTFSVVTGTVFDTDIFFQPRTVSWGDIDNDGDLDMFIGSQQGVNVADRLYQNNGNGTFTSITASPVAEVGTQTFGSAFGDIDNDGDLDLIVINNVGGNSIFINGGAPGYAFTKYAGTELLNSTGLGNIGGGFVDYDKDGFLDVTTGRNSGYVPPYLYRNTSTASSSKNWIEIKLVGTVSNYAAIGARISVKTTSPARTQIREVSARTGYGSQSSLIQHFGLGSATSISEIKVTWPNGGVQTWTSPPAGQSMNQIITIAEDLTGPTFTFNPANSATGVALGNTVTLTLSEAGQAVGGKNLYLRSTTSASSPIQTVPVTSATAGAGNSYTFTFSSNFSALTTYFIELDAGAFTDIYGNASLAVAPTAWSFTTLDNVAPTVSFTPPASIQKGSITGTTFSVTASDNVAVASVVMSYRKITATQYQTLNGTFNATSSKYDFPLQATFFDDMGMEYYFTASDGSGNSSTSPASGTDITRVAFSPTTIALAVPAGSAATDYKIISIPLDLATTNIPNIFADFGAADVTAWKLLKYQDSPQAWVTYPSFATVAKGEGYFILSRTGHNLAFDQAVAPQYSQSNLFQLNLTKGFNLIGNPYMMPINWEDSRTGVTGVNAVKLYQGGNYVDGNTIDVFSGGFVFANAAVTVPVKLKTSPNGGREARPSYTSRIDTDEWIVPIIMMQGARQFNFGGVGMSPNASLSYDGLDDLAPPSPSGKLEMEFAHPEHFMKKFSRDVVPTASGFTWTFVAASDESAPVEMKWNNTDFAESGKDLWLFDVALQRPVNMKTESSYSFSPGVSKEFKVYYGKDAAEQLKPQRVFLGLPSPNPASGLVSIPFTLPDNNAQMNVLMEVFDMTGRQVQTLLDKSLPGGFYTAGWDAGSSTVGSGFYIVKLAVSYQDRQEVAATKLIIHK